MPKMFLGILLAVQGPTPSREAVSNSGREVPATSGRNASKIPHVLGPVETENVDYLFCKLVFIVSFVVRAGVPSTKRLAFRTLVSPSNIQYAFDLQPVIDLWRL
jgi:hypothetical protein